jgi:hypothetical protein
MEVKVQLLVPAALSPGNEPPVPIGEETGWASESALTLYRRVVYASGIN